MATPVKDKLKARRALLVCDLQREFLDPCVGRCQLPGATNDKDSQPQFLKNIELLLPRLRELGVDVIWAQSEYKKRREFSDPLVEETILIFNDESSDDEENEDGNSDGKSPMTPKIPAAKRLPKLGKMCKIGGLDGTGPSRPPLLTDAYLSIETNHPPVAPSTAASEWHVPVRDMMLLNTDRIITKSWYSAFKETSLLEILRSRVVTQLCIVGLMTNIGILATAADAARHGLEVWVLEDCLGYRNKAAHDSAIQIMTEDLAVEPVNSNALTQIWGQKKSKSQSGSLQPAAELIGISAQALSKMIEGIKLKGKEGHKVEQRTVEERKDSLARVIKELDDQPIEIDPNARGPVKPSRLEGGASLTAGSTVGADRTLRHSPITKRKPKTRKTKKPKTTTVLEQDGNVGEGDSYIVSDILPGELAQSVFERVKTEVAWRSMFHRGNAVPRLVAVQGEIQDDGSFPIYRHPADESPPLLPFSPTVDMIRKEVQKVLKHPVNHVLIQHYRGGSDNISEHSDKTLDIAMGSKIVNVSVGARRTMLMHMKKDPSLEVQRCEDDSKNENWEEQILRRDMQRIPMPHNSMFVLGPETNKKWLHGIRQDKRSASIKSPEELAYNSERISLTFRHIATYLSKDEKLIYGQGATAKVKEDARPVINGDDASNQKILFAFAAENRQTDFNWQAEYGQGFDVLHFKLPTPKLLISDALDAETARIRICLYEMGLDFTEQLVGETEAVSFRSLGLRGKTPIFVDKDRERTAIEGSLVVLQYLDLIYNSLNLFPSQAESVSQFTRALSRLQESEKLIGLCEKLDATREDIERELDVWESYLQKSQYVSGDEFFLVDIAVFPALKSVYARLPGDDEKKTKFPAIRLYVDELEKRESIIKAYSTISEPLAVEEGTNDNVDALVDGLKKVTIKQD